jgi:kynurenine 3-monooxygenase
MNAGFEDCSLISELLDSKSTSSEEDWLSLLDEYTRIRKPAGDAILDLALHNYIVMRDKTSDPTFLLQKKIEARIASTHPDRWKPLYSLVTFSHIPYQDALARGEMQQAVMNEIMSTPDIEGAWSNTADEIVARAISLLDLYEGDASKIARPIPLLDTNV